MGRKENGEMEKMASGKEENCGLYLHYDRFVCYCLMVIDGVVNCKLVK